MSQKWLRTDPETRILDKDIRTIIITVYHAFKQLSTDIENVKKDPNQLL